MNTERRTACAGSVDPTARSMCSRDRSAVESAHFRDEALAGVRQREMRLDEALQGLWRKGPFGVVLRQDFLRRLRG